MKRVIVSRAARSDLYLVFYFVTKSDIRIARVLHGARDIESIFKE